MTVADAITYWKGDDTHYNTMTSPNYTQIGAGIATSGEVIYFVIDCARHIGAKTPYLTNTPAPTCGRTTSNDSRLLFRIIILFQQAYSPIEKQHFL